MRKVGLSLFFLSQAISGISQCEDMEVEVIGVNPTCYGFCDGAVFIDVLVAALPAEVAVMDVLGNEVYGLPGGEVNTLCTGWYYISVIDSLGCVFEDSVELLNPDQISVEYTIIPPSEPGACDGLGTVDTVYGYQGDYADVSIFWSPGGVADWVYEDLCAGNYTIVVNDSYGCSGVQEFSTGSLASLPTQQFNSVSLIYQNHGLYLVNEEDDWCTITCYDLGGRIVYHQNVPPGKTELNFENNSGFLVYKISTSNGEIMTGKLIF